MSGVSWTAADPEVELVATRTLLYDPSLADAALVNLDAPRSAGVHSPANSNNNIHTESTHENVVQASLSLHNSRERRRGLLRPALSTSALIAVVCFGLFASHFMKAAGDKKVLGHPSRQKKHDGKAIDSKSLLEKLKELDELQPVAASLADMLNSRESSFVLRNFRNNLEKATYMQREASPGRLSGSREAELKTVVDRSVADLQRLFELARLSGLSMEREMQETPDPPSLPDEQRHALGQIDFGVTASLAHYMRDIECSSKSYKRHAERARKGLQLLPNFTGLEDRMLLVAVNEHVELIKTAHDAVDVGMRSAEGLASTADSVMLSKAIREQMRIHRELRDSLQEWRALCDLERWQQASLIPPNAAVLDTLEKVEHVLDRGEALLQSHHMEIEQLQEKRYSLSSEEEMVKQAAAVGDELRALLHTVASDLHPIRGIADAQLTRQHRQTKAKALRASEDAEAAGKRIGVILAQVESGKLSLPSLPETINIHEEEGSETKTIVNPDMVKKVTESLQHLKDEAKATTIQLSHAAAETTVTGLEAAAEKATAATEELADKAEMLLLHAQLLQSIELDMQLSATLAERAAALCGAETKEFPGESMGAPELPSQKREQVGSLLNQVETAKAIANSQWSLVDLAATAASMKGAALGLASMVTVHHLGSTSPTDN